MDSAPGELAHLSPRHREIALLVAEGLSSKEIAHRLGINDQTVKNHKRAIFAALRCTNQVQLTRRVLHANDSEMRAQIRAEVVAELRAELAPLWRQAAARLRDLRYEIHDGVPYVRRKAAVAVVIGVLAEALDQPPHAAPVDEGA